MMTIDEIKQHLRVDGDDENALIGKYYDAAVTAVADYLNMTYDDVESNSNIAAPIKAAVLLQIADLYENRERQGDKSYFSNPTYERLLNPYRLMEI